jgi:pyruvate,water dikinase
MPKEHVNVLHGVAASYGNVTGVARVIRQPRDILAFQKGEILVSGYADPSWTPILSMAAGMVIEAGGFLSHGSIVAREYGIPALVQVEGCLERIATGNRLEVDTGHKCVRVERE